MTRTLSFAVMSALVCVSAPALAQQPDALKPAEAVCLRPINLYDFKPVPGNRSLIVIDQTRKRYRVNFMGICYNLQYHLGVAFKTRGAGNLSCVAKGDSVLIRDPVTPGPCIIRDVQYQTAAMDQADAQAAAAAKEKH